MISYFLNRSAVIFHILILIDLFNLTVNGQSDISGKSESSSAWERISEFFTPPEEYREVYGSYRSPLMFPDGRIVRNLTEWNERKNQILEYWHGKMGSWPAFIKNQKIEYIDTVRRGEGLTQFRIRFNWLPGQKTEGYLLVPDGKGKRPAVITLFYEPETAAGIGGKEYRDFAYQLAKRGFITLSIGTAETTNSKTYSLYYPHRDSSKVQPLSVLACAAANTWHLLSNHPDVDPARIGVMGHSYGGKWAMFASCLFDKFACAVWSDPGIVFDDTRPNVNYWEPWYLGYYPPPWTNTWRRSGLTEDSKGIYPVLIAEGHDLHELHALMAPRPFMVSGGSEDTPVRWIPLNHSIAVNRLYGAENRVAMTNRADHSPNEISNSHIYDFFGYFLMNKKSLQVRSVKRTR